MFKIPQNMSERARKLNILDKLSDEQIESLVILIFGSMALASLKKHWMMTPTAFMEAIGLDDEAMNKIHITLTRDALNLMLDKK